MLQFAQKVDGCLPLIIWGTHRRTFYFNLSIIYRCYGCDIPENPKNGNWDCDITSGGKTICMLQCHVRDASITNEIENINLFQAGFHVMGPHIIECEQSEKKFSSDPEKSICEESFTDIEMKSEGNY